MGITDIIIIAGHVYVLIINVDEIWKIECETHDTRVNKDLS